MKYVKLCTAVLLVLVMLIVGVVPAFAYEPQGVDVYAQAALVVDLDRDIVVYEKNADTKMYPASLTKIMTAMVVLDECSDPSAVTVTAAYEALDPLYGTDSSVCGLETGEEMTVLDLVSVMMIQSANDAANVLAYHFGGEDLSAFNDKMNKKAAELGLKNTHYTNAHGLHDSEHYTTARDLYILIDYAMQNPLFKEIVTSLYYLQNPGEPDYYYEYAAGIKTGYTDAAGLCLTSTATKDGTTYLCVVLNCPTENKGCQFTLSKSLYEWAFDALEYRTVINTETIVGEQAVKFGKGCETVPAVLQTAVESTVPKAIVADAIQSHVTWDAEQVEAPITKGQKLGTAVITAGNVTLGTVDVVASADVQKSMWKVIGDALNRFFANPLVRFAVVVLVILLVLVLLFIAYVLWARYQNRKRRRRRAERRRRLQEQQQNQINR